MKLQPYNKYFVSVNNLAPNVAFKFEVSAFRKNFIGPASSVEAQTRGISLPAITGLTGKIVPSEGTAVHLSWDSPQHPFKVKWSYGIYKAVRMEELFKGEYKKKKFTLLLNI